jgi:hypothetical protein
MESHQEQFERHRPMLQSPPKGPAVADYFRVADNTPRTIAIRVQRPAQAIIARTDGSNLWH